MDKGTRVRITSGRQGQGTTGSVFWTGPSRYGEGLRLGVRGDDGETYWVDEGDVEQTTDPPPTADAGPTFSRGDRVSFETGGRQGTGTVFWIGESRHGPGQRLGIDDDDGEEAVWLDARFAQPLGDAPPAARAGSPGEDEEGVPWDLDPTSHEMPPLDDGPPVDEGYLDHLASHVESTEDDAPPEW